MPSFKRATAALKKIFKFADIVEALDQIPPTCLGISSEEISPSQHYEHEHEPPFPQFSQLPTEIRLKIWELALEPRLLGVHIHPYRPRWIHTQQRYTGYASSDLTYVYATIREPPGLPHYRPQTEEEGYEVVNGLVDPSPMHMVLTPCVDYFNCKCQGYPPSSPQIVSLPSVLLTCHESRDVSIRKYSRRLEDEYDLRGDVITETTSHVVKSPISRPPHTGIRINPSLDALLIHVNIASKRRVEQVHQVASIVARQLPEIEKVVIDLAIAMAPNRLALPGRFNYWTTMGATGWWVPGRFLIQMSRLREVVLVRKVSDELLPPQWVERTKSQWVEELSKVEDRWPAQWNGKMPALRFVEAVEDA